MSEGWSQGSQNCPLNTGLTALQVTQEKMMVGKSVHFKTNTPPPPPPPLKKCFLPFLVSKKKNLQTIQLYTHKQEAGRNKNKLMGPSKR